MVKKIAKKKIVSKLESIQKKKIVEKTEEYTSEDLKAKMVFTIPNLLTILRMILAPVFMIALLNHTYILALIVLIVASISDFFDGFIARKFHMESKIGSIMDPVADIIFMTFTIIALVLQFGLPLWFAIIIFSRDLMILLGGLSLYFLKAKYTKENTLGKVARFVQLFTLIIYTLAYIAKYSALWVDALIYITAAITLVSIGIYVYRGYKLIKDRKKN